MKNKYDKIGKNYNATRKADSYLVKRLLYNLDPIVEELYLDIGCGTGNYTNEFQKKGFKFIGIDPSYTMLKEAKLRNPLIHWYNGTAKNTGLDSELVDGIIASLTIHHWDNLNSAFKELFRILKPEGKIVIFTSTPEQMKGYWLNYYFPDMLEKSIKQMPSFKRVESNMTQAGFVITGTEKYFVKPDLKDMFLYSGKHNPELYLRGDVRDGISSFSSLADNREVNNGLARLEDDIESGKVRKVIKSYENNAGDYLFIIGKKEAL